MNQDSLEKCLTPGLGQRKDILNLELLIVPECQKVGKGKREGGMGVGERERDRERGEHFKRIEEPR